MSLNAKRLCFGSSLPISKPYSLVFVAEAQVSKGPRGEKRPADAIVRAIMVAKIATREIEDNPTAPDGRVLWMGS